MSKVKNEVVENVEVATPVQETKAVAVVGPATQAIVVDDYDNNLMKQMDLGSFYSLKPTTKEGRIDLYNAINTPDARLADFINMTIEAKDVIVEIVELLQEATGQLVHAPRIIIIDKDGKSYACVSIGVFSGLKKIMKLFGEPTWNEPVKMMVKQVTKAEKKMLTLELVK
jgi:hypothetical protein